MHAPHNNKNFLITASVFWTPTVYSMLLSVGGQKRASARKKLADQWGRGSCDEPNCMQWDEAIPEINREAQLPREGNPAHGEHLPWESGASTGWGEPRRIWAGETATVEKGESLGKGGLEECCVLWKLQNTSLWLEWRLPIWEENSVMPEE